MRGILWLDKLHFFPEYRDMDDVFILYQRMKIYIVSAILAKQI